MRLIFTLLAVAGFFVAHAQRIYGTVFTGKGDLLPFASITVKGSSKGTSANQQGKFSLPLIAGTYTLVCQHIGYVTVEKKIELKDDEEISFVLAEQQLTMKEVIVKNGGEDPAYEIIRQAIKKRSYYNKQVKAFLCDLYSKDIIRLRSMPDKLFGQKIKPEDKTEMGLDSAGKGIVYLSESISDIKFQEPDKLKLHIQSSRVSGSNGFGFTFPAFISLYESNVRVFTDRFNPRGFVSPIADGAIHYYKFKFLGNFFEDGKMVHSIRVTPRRLYEPLFTGTINITDDDWRIQSFDLTLSKTSQLELLDTLHIAQLHVPVTGSNDVWRVKNQVIGLAAKLFKIDLVGTFLSVYSNYDVQPGFTKKTFDNVIIQYEKDVNKRSRNYWDSIRPVPLALEEQRDYVVKDSIFQHRDTIKEKRYLDSLNRSQGKVTVQNVLLTGINRTIRRPNKMPITWGIDPMIFNMEYNLAEGFTPNISFYYRRYLKNPKTVMVIEPTLRYGFANQHFNAWGTIRFQNGLRALDKPAKQWQLAFSGGRKVSDFNRESPLNPLINSISILFYGKNYIKTYENYFGSIRYSRKYENGLNWAVETRYEDRMPLNNVTNYTIWKKDSVHITPNYPNERIPAQFTRHQAAIVSFDVSIRPGQRYIQLPYSKVPMGSKYPTFSFNYTKGISGVLGSDVDFDKWQLTVKDDRNLKLAGTLRYKLGVGGFINNKQVEIQDYQHFNGNRTIDASEYVNSFQLAYYYANSTTEKFYSFAHLEHHFNGLLTNKIPLFRKLNWNLVAGSNAFFVNAKNNYVEALVGLENIFKVFRVDFVAGYLNGNKGLTGFRVGFGGALGSGIKANVGKHGDGSSLNIQF